MRRSMTAYIRFGLVFEVKDNGYDKATEQPQVKLMLPAEPAPMVSGG